MANAKLKKSEKLVKKEVVDGITLDLTIGEALALKALTGSIVGSGHFRDCTSQIYFSLSNFLPSTLEIVNEPIKYNNEKFVKILETIGVD